MEQKNSVAAPLRETPPKTRDGLEWEDKLFYVQPRWVREPQLDDIVQVCRTALSIAPEDVCTVAFLAQGAFNKVYIVETPQGRSVMRVSLPVDPGHKTRGEVTTLRWIRRITNVPVPKVIAFDDSQNNAIGFEWILMELMPGISAYKRWRKMSMPTKIWIVEQIADFQSQLFRRSLEDAKFRSVGTLASASDVLESAHANPTPGRIVSLDFFQGDRFNYDVARGPFRSSHDWLSACLDMIRQEQTEILKKEDDEDDREEAQDILELAEELTALLPKIFPSIQHPAERTVIWHQDLNLFNVLVDDDGKVTGIIDWECVSCKPLWVVTEMPEFLRTNRPREEEPQRDRYGDADKESTPHKDQLDDEGKTNLYWEHLMEYDKTQLSKVYVAKMKELWPQWEIEAEYGALKHDFLDAVLRCASGWFVGRTEDWVDAIEEGECPRLTDVLDPNKLG